MFRFETGGLKLSKLWWEINENGKYQENRFEPFIVLGFCFFISYLFLLFCSLSSPLYPMSTWGGWIIAVLGMLLTIYAVYRLVKNRPDFGSRAWVIAMLGIFSATLAITWHSHYAMAVVLVPLLVYAVSFKLLPEKPVFWWMILTPAAMFGGMILSVLVLVLTKVNLSGYQGMAISLSGFLANLILLFAATKYSGRNLLLDPTDERCNSFPA